MPTLTFVAGARCSAWSDLDAWSEDDIDRNAARFRSGIDVWIIQTYLRLRNVLAADKWRVSLASSFVPGTINVAHWDELHRLRILAPLGYLVGIRADRPPLLVADKTIRQNGVEPESATSANIPMWPQPGLVPRNPAREDRLARIGYFGRRALAPAYYSDPAFLAALASLGLELVVSERDWQNYRAIDLVLAVRDEPPSMLLQKPASKLANAWLAGVPAIVGREPAYLEMRRDDLDMIIANRATDVLAALEALVRTPARYQAMRKRAQARAVDVGVDSVRSAWLTFFRERVAPAYSQWQAKPTSPAIRYAWYARQLIVQRFLAKRFRARLRAERRAMSTAP